MLRSHFPFLLSDHYTTTMCTSIYYLFTQPMIVFCQNNVFIIYDIITSLYCLVDRNFITNKKHHYLVLRNTMCTKKRKTK